VRSQLNARSLARHTGFSVLTELDDTSALIRAFVAPERQARMLGLIGSARGRAKIRKSLAHYRDLDPRFASEIPKGEHTPEAIGRRLRARGAGATCTLLAEDAALDGRAMPLNEALLAVVGCGMGAFISCLPGRLAYFEGEDAGDRYLLERVK
jgi:hypothetical protein